jgi:hypothetical protein
LAAASGAFAGIKKGLLYDDCGLRRELAAASNKASKRLKKAKLFHHGASVKTDGVQTHQGFR